MKGFDLEPDDYYSRLLKGKYEIPAMVLGILTASMFVYIILS